MLSRYTATQLSRALAILFALVLVAYWRLIWVWFRELPRDPYGILSVIITAYLVLLLGSIVGLLRRRPWAFYCIYVMIPLNTILLSISFVPFVPNLLPFPFSTIALTALNLLVLAIAGVAHVKYKREAVGKLGSM